MALTEEQKWLRNTLKTMLHGEYTAEPTERELHSSLEVAVCWVPMTPDIDEVRAQRVLALKELTALEKLDLYIDELERGHLALGAHTEFAGIAYANAKVLRKQYLIKKSGRAPMKLETVRREFARYREEYTTPNRHYPRADQYRYFRHDMEAALKGQIPKLRNLPSKGAVEFMNPLQGK